MRRIVLVSACFLAGVKSQNAHVTDIKLLGWKPAVVGKCQDGGSAITGGTESGSTGAPVSQRACAALCDADADCVGYQHGEGVCTYFKTGVTISATTDSNVAFICVVPCGTSHSTLTATFDACVVGDRYHAVGSGGCRGNGGSNDRVNAKDGQGFATRGECEAECDNLADCVGYAYGTIVPNVCVLYGPDIAGTCDVTSVKTKEHCEDYGTCTPSDTVTIKHTGSLREEVTAYGTALNAQVVADCRDSGDKTSTACATMTEHGAWSVRNGKWTAAFSDWKTQRKFCGMCQYEDDRPIAQTKNACTGSYTWVDWTWTANQGTWTPPTETNNKFTTYEYQTTTHIHSSSPTDGVTCYELDNEDHAAQCHGIDSHGTDGTSTQSDTHCKSEFDKSDTYLATDCPTGCTYTAGPVMQGFIKTHPPDSESGITRPGWNAGVSGACRNEQGRGSDAQRAPVAAGCNAACRAQQPAAYSAADPYLGGTTAAACWKFCQDLGPKCRAYHNGPAWCTISVSADSAATFDAVSGTTSADGIDYKVFSYWGSQHPDNSTTWETATSSWSAGDDIIITDSTKPNIEYMCFWRYTKDDWAAQSNLVTAVLTLAGTVSEYDAAKVASMQAAVAANAGVDVDSVTVSVTAGSVQVTIKIYTLDASTATSLRTTLTGTGGMLATGTAFETAMSAGGVTVSVEKITGVAAGNSVGSSSNTGVIIGIIVAAVIVLAIVGFAVMKRNKGSNTGLKSAA